MATALATALAAALATPAGALTYSIDIGGTVTSFDAPAGGGAVSNFAATIAGVLFDTPDAGSTAPVYDPAENDINGAASLFGGFRNSVAAGPCLALGCVLSFEDAIGNAPPRLWSMFPVLPFPDGVIAFGEYSIAPVPLPAGLPLLAAGAAALLALGRRRAGAPE